MEGHLIMKAKLYRGKVITAFSTYREFSPIKLIDELYKLSKEIEKFEFEYECVNKFLIRRNKFVTIDKLEARKNSDMASIAWHLVNKSGEEGLFALVLSRGLDSYVKFMYEYNEDSGKTTNRNAFLRKIEDFIKG